MTEEDEEYLLEQKEIEKEEKRRQKEQERLEKESQQRKAAIKATFDTASENAQNKIKSFSVIINKLLSDAPVFLKKTSSVFKKLNHKISDITNKTDSLLSVFASRIYSLPVLFVLFLLICYCTVSLNGYKIWELDAVPATYQFYVSDFSCGIVSRVFIGEIISLFTDKVSVGMMNLIIRFAVALTLIIQSLLFSIVFRKALKDKCFPAAFLIVSFAVNPLLNMENMSAPGLLDVYLLCLLFVWLSIHKTPAVYILTPVLCVTGMAIHYEFLFTFLPPVLTLLFYYTVSENRTVKKARYGISFAAGSAVSAASFFYFVLYAKNYLKMTADAFYEHMLSRFDITFAQREYYTQIMGHPIFREYFDYYIFGIYKGEDYFGNMNDFFSFLKNWTFDNYNSVQLRNNLILFMPLFVLTSLIWVMCIRKEKGIRKLPYIFFICQNLVLIPELIISTDMWRWFSAALISQAVIFAVIYNDKKSVLSECINNKRIIPAVRIAAIILLVIFCRMAVVIT